MRLEIQATKRFEKDLVTLPKADQERVVRAIEAHVVDFDPAVGDSTRHITQPLHIRVPGGYDSSLYSLRVGQKIRVLLTIEDDPIFDVKLATLMRVVQHADLDKAYRSIAESLAQSFAAGRDSDG